MTAEHEDPRIKKTKKLLRRGISELMLLTPVGEITVKDLTDHIEISRGTFYKYYENIPSMVREIQNKLAEEFQVIVDKPINDDADIYPRPLLINLFVFMRKNVEMCLVLIGPNGNRDFVQQLSDIVKKKFISTLKSLLNLENQSNLEYFSVFVSSGCISLFEKWMKTGMKESPEEMAGLTIELLLHAYSVLLK